jgi:hypothetical protein
MHSPLCLQVFLQRYSILVGLLQMIHHQGEQYLMTETFLARGHPHNTFAILQIISQLSPIRDIQDTYLNGYTLLPHLE